MGHRLTTNMLRAFRAASDEALRTGTAAARGARPPGPTELDEGLTAVSAGLSAIDRVLADEIEETDRILTALSAAVATLSAHVVAMAEYIKYEAPEGLNPMVNEQMGLDAYIEVADRANKLMDEITGGN